LAKWSHRILIFAERLVHGTVRQGPFGSAVTAGPYEVGESVTPKVAMVLRFFSG
jgi:hypothetical protein